MTFTCIICRRNQPISLGHPLPSGSWVCNDDGDCYDHFEEKK